MSSGEDKKKLFKEIFFWGLVVLAAVLLIFLLVPKRGVQKNRGSEDFVTVPFSELEVKYLGDENLSLSATVTREKLSDFVEDMELPGGFLTNILPREVDVFCVCRIRFANGGKRALLEVKKAEVNKIGIPSKLLEYIGEINLDFKRSLVYN